MHKFYENRRRKNIIQKIIKKHIHFDENDKNIFENDQNEVK